MKRDDLIRLLQTLPEDAELWIVDEEYGDGDPVVGVELASENYMYMFGWRFGAPPPNRYVLVPKGP